MAIVSIDANLQGAAGIAASLTGVFEALAAFEGSAEVTAPSRVLRLAEAQLEGGAILYAFGTMPVFAALGGAGDLGAAGVVFYAGFAGLDGVGNVTAQGALEYPVELDLSGGAELTAAARSSYNVVLGLAGEGELVATSLGDYEMAADLVGGADVIASLTATLPVNAELGGGGEITAYGLVRKPPAVSVPVRTVRAPRVPKVLETHYTITTNLRRRGA